MLVLNVDIGIRVIGSCWRSSRFSFIYLLHSSTSVFIYWFYDYCIFNNFISDWMTQTEHLHKMFNALIMF